MQQAYNFVATHPWVGLAVWLSAVAIIYVIGEVFNDRM